MNDYICFAAIEFTDDPNVAGHTYWYACDLEGIERGDEVLAPLGRHNRLQKGIVRQVRMSKDYEAPFPVYVIKYIKDIVKKREGATMKYKIM